MTNVWPDREGVLGGEAGVLAEGGDGGAPLVGPAVQVLGGGRHCTVEARARLVRGEGVGPGGQGLRVLTARH